MLKLKVNPSTLFIGFVVYALSIMLLIFTAIGLGTGTPLVVSNNWWNLIFALVILGFYTLFFLVNALMKNEAGTDAPDIVDAGVIIGYVIFFVLSVVFLDIALISIDLLGFFFRFTIFTIATIQAVYVIGRKA